MEGRVYVEQVNSVFLREGGRPNEYRAGIEQMKADGLIDMHVSGAFSGSRTRVPSVWLKHDAVFRWTAWLAPYGQPQP